MGQPLRLGLTQLVGMVRPFSTFITTLPLGQIPSTLYSLRTISCEIKISQAKIAFAIASAFKGSIVAKIATQRLITPFPDKPLLAEMQSVFSRLHWIEDRYGPRKI